MCDIIVKKKKIQSSNGVTAKKRFTHTAAVTLFHLFRTTVKHFFSSLCSLVCMCQKLYIFREFVFYLHTVKCIYIIRAFIYIYGIFDQDNSFQEICARPICSSHASLLYIFILYYTCYTLQFYIKLFSLNRFFILIFFSHFIIIMSKNKYIINQAPKDSTTKRIMYKLNLGTTIF